METTVIVKHEIGYQEIVLNNEAILPALLSDLNKAKEKIAIETYMFDEGIAANMVADALCEAAKRGVEVRVLVDGIGSLRWGNSVTSKLEKCGVLTRVYHPVPFLFRQLIRSAHSPNFFLSKIMYLLSKLNSRDHRKVWMIDGKIVYVGSANITDHLLASHTWRDTTVKLIDIPLDDLEYAFDKAWKLISLTKRFKKSLVKIDPDPIFRLNEPWRRRHKLYQALISRIAHCNERIWVTNSYFVPDNHLLQTLIKASRNGVDVRILLPEKSDVLISSLAAYTFYSILVKNGVLIYEYKPTMLHAKILILDNWISIGSTNLNYRSLKHDLEVDVNIRSSLAKKQIINQFQEDLMFSKAIQLTDLQKRPFYIKWLGRLILLIRFWI